MKCFNLFTVILFAITGVAELTPKFLIIIDWFPVLIRIFTSQVIIFLKLMPKSSHQMHLQMLLINLIVLWFYSRVILLYSSIHLPMSLIITFQLLYCLSIILTVKSSCFSRQEFDWVNWLLFLFLKFIVINY